VEGRDSVSFCMPVGKSVFIEGGTRVAPISSKMRGWGGGIFFTAFLGFFFWGFPQAFAGRPAPRSVECPSLSGWANLGAHSGCRLRFRWAEREASVCLSEAAALAWLEGDATCFSGRWKVRSAPAVGFGWNALKKTELQFLAERQASGLEKGEAQSSLFFRLKKPVERLRFRLSVLLEAGDRSGALRSLLLGQSAGATSAVLRELGHVHVMTATGIHLYAVARWSEKACEWGLSRFPFGSLFQIQRSARIAARLLWFWLWILAGARPGMLRPLCVVVLRMGAEALGLRWRAWAPLLLSLLLDLGVALFWSALGRSDAWAPGRWLYAGAVGGGLLALEYARGRGAWTEHLALAVGSWALVAPAEALLRGWVAPGTPVWSLIEIPFLASWIYPLSILISGFLALEWLELARLIASALGEGVSLGLEAAAYLSMSQPGWLWLVSPLALLGGVTIALLLWGRSFRASLLTAVFLGLGRGAIFFFSPELPAPSVTLQRLVQLDVGQGDAAWLESSDGKGRSRALGFVDVGSPSAWREALAWEWLGKNRVNKIDYVLLTHLDQDHAGELETWVSRIPIGCVTTSQVQWRSPRGQALAERLEASGVRVHSVEEDQGRPREQRCFPFKPLPPAEVSASRTGRKSANFGMTGVWVPFPEGGGYLNLGDADSVQELRFLRAFPLEVRSASLFKLSHHGSKTSSASELLKVIHPERVWLSAGVGNPHGHPHPDILWRLSQAGWGPRFERTDRVGSLEWKR